ncbi:uncharacterized protein LOC108675560 [Hyalella azteca]|uniref:Uncharacterized protein LOC108675560 n=1 Tax=Hyalella azteca TaxID=294128 RepID=A0A8B7P1Y2_HYAAZ|nr:uncharacterized protein LOC108675560 [Hyalella azteca]XP_018019072.1 uncharacterized protein LOC108675560 [Hyalella azteca]
MQREETRAGPCKIGVRFDSYYNVLAVQALPRQIDDVYCVRGTYLTVSSSSKDEITPVIPVSSFFRRKGFRVTRWHFPDLCDEDLDWMIGILLKFRDSCLRVVLPRNGLTATGARRLFEELPQIREVYHDPGAALLTSAGSAPDLTFIELSTNNIIQWL